MTDEPGHMLRFRVLRYTPNLIRDEWVNVGVLLEEQRISMVPLNRVEKFADELRPRLQ